MNRSPFFCLRSLWVCLYLLLPVLRAEEPSLADLDRMTAQWIALRGTLAEEQRQWRTQQKAWESEIALLEEEAEQLGTQLEGFQDTVSTVEEQSTDLMKRRGEAERSLEETDQVLETASRQATQLYRALPEPLQAELSPELRSFAQTGAPDLPRTQRAQRLVAFLSAVEAMQNQFHATRESVQTEQGPRQVDILYLGLARGFAISPKSDWVAVGLPGPDGWTWTPGGADAAEVRTLLDVFQRQETATLAELPLAVEAQP